MIVIGCSKIDVQKIEDIVYSPRPKERVGSEVKVYFCRLTFQPYFAWESKPAKYRTRIYAGTQAAELIGLIRKHIGGKRFTEPYRKHEADY